jgi:hypothetical protein
MSVKALVASVKRLAIGGEPAPAEELFTATDPVVDGDSCDHDCATCTIKYPKGFKIEEEDELYGFVKGWETHLIVATGKTDWTRDVESENGSVMQAVGHAVKPTNGVSYHLWGAIAPGYISSRLLASINC